MANIREAFDYAAQNPDSDFAKNLEQLAASGALDVDAQKFGIDLTPFKPAKVQEQSSATFSATGDENLISGTAKAVGNIPSSALNLGRNIVKAVANPIDTIKGVRDIVAGAGGKLAEIGFENTDIGQKILASQNEKRVAAGMQPFAKDEEGRFQVPDTEELQKFKQLGQFLSDRYGSEEAIKKSLIEDPVGVLADVSTILTGTGAALRSAGNVSKVSALTEAGNFATKTAQAVEPLTAITGATKTITGGIKSSTPGRIVGEIIPTATDFKRSQVVKALDLTQGDLATISKKTGNDVTDFIVSKNLIKETPEAIADSLNTLRKDTMAKVRSEVSNVKTTYTPEQLPGVKQGLTTILDGVDGVAGLEKVASEIKNLATKTEYTLDDVQRAKELIDENSNIYSKIGDVKSGSTAKGLDNIRSGIRSFIEDEVSKATQGNTNIGKLNNDVATSYAIEDAINTRATRNLTRQKISVGDSLAFLGGTAAFNPLVGVGIYLGKKLIETPSFRLAFTKALSARPSAKVKRIVEEVINKTVSPETQKMLNQIADEARKNAQIIESSSTIVEKAKENQKQQPQQ